MAGALFQTKVSTIVTLAEQIARAAPQAAEPALRIARLAQELESGPERSESASPPPALHFPRDDGTLQPAQVSARMHVLAGRDGTLSHLRVRNITAADLKTVLAKGLDDFWEMTTHIVFLCVIYPVVGLILAAYAFGHNVLALLYPLAAGFALIGPLAAIWLYELSRRREQGLPTDWKYAFDVLKSPAIGSIAALGVMLLGIFLVWLITAQGIYEWLYGYRQIDSLPAFIGEALTTSRGWTLILVGNAVGFVFAVVALAVSVISFPLLLDRDVGVVCAVETSVRAVLVNPVTMSVWGLIVAAVLAIGSVPLFVGLAVAMPLLGHSTWHLYRCVVEPPGPEAARP
jgi:uncharacterized membrane protein